MERPPAASVEPAEQTLRYMGRSAASGFRLLALFMILVGVSEVVIGGRTGPSAIPWLRLSLGIWMLFQARSLRRTVLLEIGPRWLLCGQQRSGTPMVLAWSDLVGIAWLDAMAPAFRTSSGRIWVLSLHGLSRRERKEVHAVLSDRVPGYADALRSHTRVARESPARVAPASAT
jgi:hypothetical protein